MTHDTAEEQARAAREMPIIVAKVAAAAPVSKEQLNRELAAFSGSSICGRFFGPGGISDDGIPWAVIVAHDPRAVRQVRELGAFGMLVWAWNVTPSVMVSLTVAYRNSPQPHMRWVRSGFDPIIDRLRECGRIRVCLAHASGAHSGWFEGVLSTTAAGSWKEPQADAFNRQFAEFPVPGIRYSRLGARFDPDNREEPTEPEDQLPQIPLWAEPVSDCWKTLSGSGPWSTDPDANDQRFFAWANAAYQTRDWQAGWIQTIKDRQELDGVAPYIDAQGEWQVGGADRDRVNRALAHFPLLRALLVAVAGPSPDAHAAYDAAFEFLYDAGSVYAFVDVMRVLGTGTDEKFALAVKCTIEAAMLDWRITATGTRRPWLKNLGEGRLSLESFAIDLEAPVDDIETLWRSGLELLDLIDAGLWFGPHDFPVPPRVLCAAMQDVRLEGSVDEARAIVQQLLQEAQEARQWSVPWGARVEVDFGPFKSMKIHEHQGEFACVFLDEQERYYHVAIGLASASPRVATLPFTRTAPDATDASDVEWNDDAVASLELIAAAIVRDFLVVEEREGLFKTRPMRRRVRGRNVSTIIYLPRVRYTTPRTEAEAENDEGRAGTRARHPVAHHLRRAGHASPGQRFLAQRYGIAVPEGFTFVRPHERGTAAEESRIRVYRSRSASRMLFQELAAAPQGSRPAWFEFERDCARLLRARGMSVIHQSAARDGDGGVDLYAVEASGVGWVVQCKCWAATRPVGPEFVRELVGAVAAAGRGGAQPPRGMLITTSRFTSGAVSEARANDFEIMDGEAVARALRALQHN